ncbi:MAG: hypothetical protein KGO81_15235 [Bacteroidota bacterium]|nr:hypothetical protein [Bacteroidota bacterium]
MNTRRKNALVITTSSILVIAIVLGQYIKMFGKFYIPSNDFTCCKGDRLYTHHYFVEKFFWINIQKGYTAELVGKSAAGGCNIVCPTDIK